MTSRIATDRRADPPITIPPARFRGASSEARSAIDDRRYIDDQIVGIERHLEALLLNGVIGTWARVSPSSAADIQPGDVVCLFGGSTPTELRVILANSAALADSGAPLGIALTAVAKGTFGQFAIAGAIPQSVTGLDAAAGFARIDANGHAEWVANYSNGDYPLGTVDGGGSLAITMVPRIGSVGVAAVNVVAPILNSGSPTAPILELDYALAATANKVPIRGADGEGKFARVELGPGTMPTAGTNLILAASGAQILATRTALGGSTNILLSESEDGLVEGNDDHCLKVLTRVKTGGYWRLLVAGVQAVQANATGVNIATGLTYQVNGVAHATAATNSSLAFRGSSAELSVGYLYSAGTVSTTGFIRLARNFTAIACKTIASTDHPILVEDNNDGFVMGSSTLTAGWTWHVKTGGAHTFKVHNAAKLAVSGTADVALATLGTASTLSEDISGPGFVINSGYQATLSSDGSITVKSGAGEDFSLKNGTFVGVYMDNTTVYIATNAHAFTATGLGFYGTSPIAKPTVSGSRGGNAALASLLTALANLGLIKDSSS